MVLNKESLALLISLSLHLLIISILPRISSKAKEPPPYLRLSIRKKEIPAPPVPLPPPPREMKEKKRKPISPIVKKQIPVPLPPEIRPEEPLIPPPEAKIGLPPEALAPAPEGSGLSVPTGNIPEGIVEPREVAPPLKEEIAEPPPLEEEIIPAAPVPIAKPKPNFVPLFSVTRMPTFKVRITPEYPLTAKKMGKEGRVELEVSISKEGEVLEVEIIKSGGYGFDEAALESLRQSKFSPAMINDQAVDVKLRIPIYFKFKE